MKPKPDVDSEFAAPSRQTYPLARTCGLLFLLALIACLTLRSLRTASAPPAIMPGAAPVLTANGLTIQPAAQLPPARLARPQPSDHFVVMASPAIDPQMVHRAPVEIDQAMVFPTPDRESVSPGFVAPQGVIPEQPEAAPILPPYRAVPDPQVLPQAPAPTNPR
jgi:hypothetical protein